MGRYRIGPWAGAVLGAVAGLVASVNAARGTWSIIIIDVRTGEVAAASATCLTGFDLQANTPVLITGVGAATAQSFVDAAGLNRTYIRDRLLAGDSMEAILAGLAARDSGHQTRQYGIADTRGGTLTFSGTGAGAWAGGRTGRVGDLVYAVQGNVLTGPPVVDLAVSAIENTPGDVAAKLMAAMEAARSMGGDGRCSCNPNDADGCGSPPPTFTKSADIAYMLIARAGDVWSCRGVYRTQSGATAPVIFDATADGLPEVFLGAQGSPPGLLTLLNTSSPDTPRFADTSFSPGGGAIRGLTAMDANFDGLTDMVGCLGTTDRVVYLRRNPGDGVPSFSTAAVFPVGDNPGPIVTVDVDRAGGLDLATLNQASNDVSILLGAGDGTFGAQTRFSVPANGTLLAAGDVTGDGHADIITAHAGNARSLQALIGDGRGGFAIQAVRASLPAVVTTLIVGDVTGDGRSDIITGGGSTVTIIRDLANPASDIFVPSANAVAGVDAADMDGDGVIDLVTGSSSGRITFFRGTGDGAFTSSGNWQAGFTPSRVNITDMDADGDLDVVYTTSGGTVVTMTNLAGMGRLPDFENAGCASGTGFMEFNIANQQRNDPDPVFQLRELYDAWRQELIGVPDAVTSTAEWLPRAEVPADGHATRTLRVTLRDWQGELVTQATSLMVERVGGTGGTGAFSPESTIPSPGVFDITVQSGRGCGDAVFQVATESGGRQIQLMPRPVLWHTTPADANDDGFVDFFDHMEFITAYETGDPRADLTGDDQVTVEDYQAFIRAFESGC